MNDNKTNGKSPRHPTLALVTRAVREARCDAIELHRRMGLPLVFWEDGQVIYVSADEFDETGALKKPAQPTFRRAKGAVEKRKSENKRGAKKT